MRLNTVFEYPHIGTLIKYTATTDPSTGKINRIYYEVGDIRVKVIPGRPSGGRPVLYTDEKLSSFDRIANIRDTGGKVLGGDTEFGYEINMVVPVLNPFGYLDGYSYGLTRLVGDPLDAKQFGG
jgi:hypothetical protein